MSSEFEPKINPFSESAANEYADVGRQQLIDEIDRLRRVTADLEIKADSAEYSATHDDLTMLPIRRYLKLKMRELEGTTDPIAILFVDSDSISKINNTINHDKGDEAILHTAAALKESLRKDDFVARIGGDEFVAVLLGSSRPESEGDPPTAEQRALIAMERVSQKVTAINDADAELKQAGFNISVGFSVWHPDQQRYKDVIAIADGRMYEQKKKHYAVPALAVAQIAVMRALSQDIQDVEITTEQAIEWLRNPY